MDIYNGLAFEKVMQNDVMDMTKVMKRAFDEDTKCHLGEECGGPPGYDNEENYLGNMFLDVQYQDSGYGTIIWKYIENKFPNTRVWKTDTPGFSKRNHNFYINKCGFKLISIENPKDKYEESYVLEKIMNSNL